MWDPIKIKWQTNITETKLNRVVEVRCDLLLTAKISGDTQEVTDKVCKVRCFPFLLLFVCSPEEQAEL